MLWSSTQTKLNLLDPKRNKQYMFYSGYMGNEKYRTVADFRENRPEFIITNAVKGIYPEINSQVACSPAFVFCGWRTPLTPHNSHPLFFPSFIFFPHECSNQKQDFIATGRRKTSTARVRIRPGTGTITINNRDIDDYCSTNNRKRQSSALLCVEKNGQLDVSVNVRGGELVQEIWSDSTWLVSSTRENG